jgi:hypothetical protein
LRNILRDDSQGACQKPILRNGIHFNLRIAVLNDQTCSITTKNEFYIKVNYRRILIQIMNSMESGTLIHHSRMNKRCFSKYRINA